VDGFSDKNTFMMTSFFFRSEVYRFSSGWIFGPVVSSTYLIIATKVDVEFLDK